MGSMAEVGMGVDWRGLAIAAVRAVAACRTRRQDAAGLRLLLLHFPATIEAALRRAGPDDEAEQQTQAPKRARREDEPAPEPSLASSWVHVLPPEAFVPHAVLFPRCRAVVHHGGLGTTVACIRYGGPPQLVVPCTEEQAMWGAVVAYKGMGLAEGLSLRRGEEGGGVSTAAAGAALAAALARLLDEEDAMRAAAAQVRAAMAGEDGVGTAVRVLEEMIDDEQARS